ncbi:hypothetical protein KBD45_05025, partial [Candidatus Dojkabacteria bacterium]|nr:hypothetical protein [Candidatus Dojkabacteria bacterium]
LTIINIPYIFVANTLTNYTIMTSLFATAGLAISDKYSMWLGNFAGFAFMSVFWNLFHQYDLEGQYYIFSIFIYLLFLSFRYYRINNKNISFILEVSAYLIQSIGLLFDSIFQGETHKIVTGILLIILASAVAIMGSFRKNKILVVLGIIFLILELIVRLYVIIVSLDWWVYLLLIGILMISGAIFIFIKAGNNKQ